MYFRYFVIISPWKRVGPFIWTNLNPLYPRMFCAKFGWNWPSGSGEEDFFNFINVFSLFHNYMYLPLEEGGALHLNKFESPLPKDALCQVWLKLAQWFWRRRWQCEKFTDGRRTTGDKKSSLELKRWRPLGLNHLLETWEAFKSTIEYGTNKI